MKHLSKYSVAAAAATAVLVVGTAVPATASDATPVEVEPSTGVISVDDSTQRVTVAALEGEQVSIDLPGQSVPEAVDTAAVSAELFRGGGAALLSTQDQGSTVSSYATANGVQTLIEIPDASASKEYRFPLTIPEGGQAVQFPDGIIITNSAGNAIGGFKAPWAVDAHGNDVATEYRIEGNTLVQTVHFTSETAFPVIADPEFGSEWWGWYIQLNYFETRDLANAMNTGSAPDHMVGVLCAAAPGPIALACGAAVVIAFKDFIDPPRNAAASGRCVALNLPWAAISHPQVFGMHMTVVDCR